MKTNGEKGSAGIYIGTIIQYHVIENFQLDLKGYAQDVLVISVQLENGEILSQKVSCSHTPYEQLLFCSIDYDFNKILGKKIAFDLEEENGELVIKGIFSPDKII